MNPTQFISIIWLLGCIFSFGLAFGLLDREDGFCWNIGYSILLCFMSWVFIGYIFGAFFREMLKEDE